MITTNGNDPSMASPLTGKNIIVCGYHWVGARAVELLRSMGANVYVYTHPSGEGVPCVANYCRKAAIPCSFERISADALPFTPDAIASIYYRYLIKPDLIARVNGKIFNLHPSLLPKYRGCSSLAWAMMHNQAVVGYTYHYIDAGCDTGNIILQKPMEVEPFDTLQTLYYRVMFQAVTDLIVATKLVLNGFPGSAQSGEPSYFKRGAPYNGVIDPAWDIDQVERFIRVMTFPPYPYATAQGNPVRTFDDYLAQCEIAQ